MEIDRIRTSHDLADLLEEAAQVLRMLPAMPLASVRRSEGTGASDSKEQGGGHRRRLSETLQSLAEKLPQIDRLEAETELSSLPVYSIQQLAPLLGVRMPSKATKNEYIRLLLSQVFDAPAGQEVVRTFRGKDDLLARSKSVNVRRRIGEAPEGRDRSGDAGGPYFGLGERP